MATVSVLAEEAMPRSEVTQSIYDRMVTDAKDALELSKKEPSSIDAAAKTLADVIAIAGAVGLSARE